MALQKGLRVEFYIFSTNFSILDLISTQNLKIFNTPYMSMH